MNASSVTILICTYNRAPLLQETLAALQDMTQPDGCAVDIVVVDNNSTDDTARIVSHAARIARFPITLLQERKQGKSFALNTGLAVATGDILALTDDDVLPATDWLVRIVENFRTRDVTFVFGKVLPRWASTPPAELLTVPAQAIWGPLAIVDYGDAPADYQPDSQGQRLPIGANLSFRRSALVTIGGWRTDLGKVNNTLISGEDHEIFTRLRRHGLYAGCYDPRVAVRHFVPAARLTRKYFRRWFYWHGKTLALMLDDMYPELNMALVPRIAGVPRFAFRQGLEQAVRWLKTRHGDALVALIEEMRLLQFVGLYVQCWQRRKRQLRAATRTAAVVAAALLGLGVSAPAHAASRVQLTISSGRVWLVAHDATLQQILAEWARVGGTAVEHADAASPAPIDIELAGVAEAQALATLLRDASAIVVGRTHDGAGRSSIARIIITPSTAPKTTGTSETSGTPGTSGTPETPAVHPVIGLDGLPVPDDQQ